MRTFTVELKVNVRRKKPSSRGELEITDLNIICLKQQKLSVKIMGRGYACLDIRTHAKECDIIYLMTNWKIIDSGLYQELLDSNEEFKKIAKNA